MFSQSEKITARPGVFGVVGVTQILYKKWPKLSFSMLHINMRLAVVFYTGADLELKLVKIARQFPLKVDKSALFS